MACFGRLARNAANCRGCAVLGAAAADTQKLLVQGGTPLVGRAAIGLARDAGATVCATSRNLAGEAAGAQESLPDSGLLHETVSAGRRFEKVLELAGTTTLLDSLRCLAPGGVVCRAGMAGDPWVPNSFEPMIATHSRTSLMTCSGGVEDFLAMPLDHLLAKVAKGTLPIRI